MKFGKLADISSVNFQLAPDAPGTAKYLETLSAQSPEGLYVGCTGWSMKEWLGKVYPAGTKSTDFLKHYSRQFNTIELNTTHYRIPTRETIHKWYRDSAEDFRFCPKIPQVISHSRNLGIGTDNIIQFCEAIEGLAEKLGCCFMQLPPYFGLDRRGLLERFLEQFPSSIPLAVEVRHQSWFENDSAIEQFGQLLEEYQKAPVITDVAGRRDVLHQRLSHPIAVIRFVGNALDSSDFQRIDDWIIRMQSWFSKGLQAIYFFTHEPDNILAPDLADYLVRNVQQNTDISVRGPNFFSGEEGKQISLF